MGFLSRLFGTSRKPAHAEPRQAAESRRVTATTRHEKETDQTWRTGERVVSEFEVAGNVLMTAAMEISAGPGFLGLSGESHYQDALRAAKRSKPEPDPSFWATLVAEPMNAFDPNAVAVIIEPFGTVGYVPKSVAARFQRIVKTASGTVQCQAQIRGGTVEKPLIGVVLDTTRSTGARLSMHAEDNSQQLDEYWTIRRASDELAAAAKAQESVDSDEAARQYRRALSKSIEAEAFSTSRSIFPGDDPDNRHLRLLDRLTLCLVRCGCSSEAAEEAAAYFAKFPALRSTKVGLAITKRIEKAGRPLAREDSER